MPLTAHSIALSDIALPHNEVVERIWRALETLGVKSGGAYCLKRYTPDGSIILVADREGLPRESLPAVEESPDSYNSVTYSLWIDTMEILMLADGSVSPPEYTLVFMGNATKRPGQAWLARACEALLVTLGIEVAVLLASTGEETETEHRRAAGTPLVALVFERLRGLSPLGPPLLAVVDAKTVPSEIYEEAHAIGVRVGTMPSGAVMFSTIHS